MSESAKSFIRKITKKVLAKLNLTEEGRIDNFFEKIEKMYKRDIKNLNKNLDTIQDVHNDKIEELEEKLADANERLEEAYTSVTIEDIDTNEKQNNFIEIYEGRIEKAMAEVRSIENQIKAENESFEAKVKDYEEQIAERQARLSKIA